MRVVVNCLLSEDTFPIFSKSAQIYKADKLKASVQNHRIAWAGQDINDHQVPTPSYG